MDIVARVTGTDQEYAVVVCADDTTDTLKSKVAEACGIDAGRFTLWYDGNLVELQARACDMGFVAGDEVVVEPASPHDVRLETEILHAVKAQNVAKLTELHAQGKDTLFNVSKYPHPFLIACGNGSASIVRWYLDHGANPNLKTRGTTPLHEACKYIVSDWHKSSHYWWHTSHASKDKTPVVVMLLNAGANPRVKCSSLRQTPIFLPRHGAMTAALLAHDISLLDEVDSDGNTPLHFYAWANVPSVLSVIPKNEETRKYFTVRNAAGDIPLQACGYPYSCVPMLVPVEDEDLGVTNDQGEGLLHYCANREECCETVKLLIARGLNVKSRDKKGQTPLHHCTSAAVARVLLDAGADIDAQDNVGYTPLHVSRTYVCHDFSLFLGEAKASLTIKDNRGWSALFHFARSDYSLALAIARTQYNCLTARMLLLWTQWGK